MKTLREGLLSGLLAGLLLGVLFFVDYGPGNDLKRVAAWFALDNPATGRLIGFFLLIILGGLFGLLLGVALRNQVPTLLRSLVTGLATGVVFYVLIAFLLGTLINHRRFDFGEILFSFVMLLVYGAILGSIYFQRITSTQATLY